MKPLRSSHQEPPIALEQSAMKADQNGSVSPLPQLLEPLFAISEVLQHFGPDLRQDSLSRRALKYHLEGVADRCKVCYQIGGGLCTHKWLNVDFESEVVIEPCHRVELSRLGPPSADKK